MIASFFYSSGCALIHFVMFFVEWKVLRWPNIEKAIQFDSEFKPIIQTLIKNNPLQLTGELDMNVCENWATKCQTQITITMVLHGYMTFVTFFNEAFDGTFQGFVAVIHTFLFILGIFYQIYNIITQANIILELQGINDFKIVKGYSKLGVQPLCFENNLNIFATFGRSSAWMQIEVTVFILYYFTMFLYVLKSRCRFVGIHPLSRFDPFYLSLMWNEVLNHIELDLTGIKFTKEKQLDYWTSKKRHLTIYMKPIYIKLDKQTFNKMWKRRLQQRKDIIEPSKALRFLQKCVIGDITKEQLDESNVRIISEMDMMSNSGIIWH